MSCGSQASVSCPSSGGPDRGQMATCQMRVGAPKVGVGRASAMEARRPRHHTARRAHVSRQAPAEYREQSHTLFPAQGPRAWRRTICKNGKITSVCAMCAYFLARRAGFRALAASRPDARVPRAIYRRGTSLVGIAATDGGTRRWAARDVAAAPRAAGLHAAKAGIPASERGNVSENCAADRGSMPCEPRLAEGNRNCPPQSEPAAGPSTSGATCRRRWCSRAQNARVSPAPSSCSCRPARAP